MRKTKPTVKGQQLFLDPAEANAPPAPIQMGSSQWSEWLAQNSSFVYSGEEGHFTAQREVRRGGDYWYAYRRIHGKLQKSYLGKSEELTPDRVQQVSARLAGQFLPVHLSSKSNSTDWLTTIEKLQTSGPAVDEKLGALSFLSLTKIRPPALPPKLVSRERFNQYMHGPVTLLSAPSGFGKSTLLNDWQQNCGMPVAWVSLEAEDNHPQRFWAAVVAALQATAPDLSQEWLPRLSSGGTALFSDALVNFTDEVERAAAKNGRQARIVLILDDFHHIQDPQIQADLQVLLEHLPAALHLVISSRTQPPLALEQIRATGLLVELKTDDLRFTLEEGRHFLEQYPFEHHLAYNEVDVLIRRTEGWAAGLALAAQALSQQNNPRQFVQAFSGAHDFLREYFQESILSLQPPEVQAFLLKTSILRQLTGPLCDQLTGQTNGADMLAQLWHNNLFLVRLEQPSWYRYHDLFSEMLSFQLKEQYSAEIATLHRRAAEWYRANAAPAAAVYHLLAIKAWEEAAALIESMALLELEQVGEDSQLLRWLQQLPEMVVQQHKTLLGVYLRLARLAILPVEVEHFLARAEVNITRSLSDHQTQSEQEILAEIQRFRRLWSTSHLVMSELPTSEEHNDVWQLLNGIEQYHRYYRKDPAQAAPRARLVYENALARRHLFVMLLAGGGYVELAVMMGHLRRSEKISYQILNHVLALRGKLPEPASIALVTLSWVHYERNQLLQAGQFLARAIEVDPNSVSTNMPIMVAIMRAKFQSAQGDPTAAFTTLQAARELHARRPSGVWIDQDLVAYQSLFCLRQGDSATAEIILGESGEAGDHPLSSLVLAAILLEKNQAAAAQELLCRLIEQNPNGFYKEPILGARVMLAQAFFKQHQINQARLVMAEAIRLAGPETFIRPFLDYTSPSLALLWLVLSTERLSSGNQAFLRELIGLVGGTTAPAMPKAELEELSIAASISPREQQLLQLVSAGLSNHEIATRLSISASTVQTHLENIYRKLEVTSRTQAIARAQSLNLV